MKRLLLVILLVFISSCSCRAKRPIEPQNITLPKHCHTAEVARFHKNEDTLLVYDKETSPERQKDDLRCMMLKSLGDSYRRYAVGRSIKPFGVSIFDLSRFTVFRYFVSPRDNVLTQEVVLPISDKKDEFRVRSLRFWGSNEEIVGVLGAEGQPPLPLFDGEESIITREQLISVIQSYLHSQPDPVGPKNRLQDGKE